MKKSVDELTDFYLREYKGFRKMGLDMDDSLLLVESHIVDYIGEHEEDFDELADWYSEKWMPEITLVTFFEELGD